MTAGRATVWLVRHAPTSWSGIRFCGRSDPPLDPAAEPGPATIAARVAALAPTGTPVVSSPLRRAVDTAGPIAEALGSQVRVDPAWVEADMGGCDGLTFDEIATTYPDLAEALLAGEGVDWPGGEHHAEVVRRIEDAWRAVAASGPAIVVTHGGPIRIIRDALGAPAAHVPAGAIVAVHAGRVDLHADDP